MSLRDEYVQKMKAQLDQWNAELQKLEAKTAEAQADAKIKFERELVELRQRRDEAQKKLVELQKAGDEAWQDMVQGTERMWNAMNDAFQKAWSRFK